MALIKFILHIDKYLAGMIASYGLWVYGILFVVIFVMLFVSGTRLHYMIGSLALAAPVLYFLIFSVAGLCISISNCVIMWTSLLWTV